jgi:hypothetical protein
MGIKDRRKLIKLGGSDVVSIPSLVSRGEEATIAGNRLLLIDPRGEIPEDELLEFLENRLEPEFWKWTSEKKQKKVKK